MEHGGHLISTYQRDALRLITQKKNRITTLNVEKFSRLFGNNDLPFAAYFCRPSIKPLFVFSILSSYAK